MVRGMRRRFAAAALVPWIAACGARDAEPSPAGSEPAAPRAEGATGASPSPAPAPAARPGTPAGGDGGSAGSGGRAEAAAPGGDGDGPADLPCEVRWDDGPRLRLQRTEAGGSMFLDLDGDGTNDRCATFKLQDGEDGPQAVGYLRWDEGCDRKAESIVRATPRPQGLWRVSVESEQAVRTFAALPLPLPLAAGPFLLLDKTPGAYAVTRTCERPTSVAEKRDAGRAVTLHYEPKPCDPRARLSRIEDDRDGDGKADLTLRLSYDAAGRVVSVARATKDGAATAAVRYDCKG